MVRKKISKTFEKVNIGKIPIMLQSKLCVLGDASFELRKQMGECPFDQGGYFVIDGQEKVIVSHERKAENKLYIVKSMMNYIVILHKLNQYLMIVLNMQEQQ